MFGDLADQDRQDKGELEDCVITKMSWTAVLVPRQELRNYLITKASRMNGLCCCLQQRS